MSSVSLSLRGVLSPVTLPLSLFTLPGEDAGFEPPAESGRWFGPTSEDEDEVADRDAGSRGEYSNAAAVFDCNDSSWSRNNAFDRLTESSSRRRLSVAA